MSHMLQPSILLLREGTDDSQGRSQIISNINACQSIVEVIKTTLGPRGMDKMITQGGQTTISNDGATILKLLDIVHPAAKSLVDIARSQDNEVGDGTTSVTLLGGELLKEAKNFIEEGLHSQIIIQGYKEALRLSLEKLKTFQIKIDREDPVARRDMLIKCAQTALNSKLLNTYKQHFGELVVQSIEKLDPNLLDKDLVGVKGVSGGSITESFVVDGVAFKKTFSYAGFEQQPKHFLNPKICLLNLELELKSEKENAEIRIDRPEDYQSIIDAEWSIIYEKLQKIVDSGANIVLSKLPVGDLATQYFADRQIFCAGRVPNDDMVRLQSASGAMVQTTVNGLSLANLGTCGEFEEKQIGVERYNIFKQCPQSKTATIILRGGAEQFIKEAERSLNDSIMVVRRAMKFSSIVAGGGAIEMELSRYLRHHARSIQGKQQLIINAFAKALEVIPRTIAENAGLDSIEVMNRLRQKHAQDQDGKHFGVGINSNIGISNTYDDFVWEPTLIKQNALAAACEVDFQLQAANTILSIDETVRNPQSEQAQLQQRGRPGQGGRQINAAGLAKNMRIK